MLTLISSAIAFAFPILILVTALIMSARSTQDREKLSPFECGFDPKSSARIPFSLRFFLLAVIFLVFDIEIALLMPTPIIAYNYMPLQFTMGAIPFLLILMIGLLHEWREGSLDWTS
uniref:NADH-ubiquinone oxidoreductase chain 3 n=1 Tax=Goniada japonica TaxID=1644143 RepID=A0A0F6QQ36_9ANNE|nr:NADH dehydrogenase subunit 3 [Goniada japonica]AKE32092.1 NADH dehydrogenase subunit 3 [Goniada japonica]